jgi:ParB-like chromosome segregation protein Spo0J
VTIVLIPSMRDDEYEGLREDVAANGLRHPITVYEGKILDGRHRLRACEEAGVVPVFEEYSGDEPAAYVISLNVRRRNLTASQKAMIAADFLPYLEAEAKVRQGTRTDLENIVADRPQGRKSREEAAELTGASGRSVARAKRVREADPELAERVLAGDVSISAADDTLAGRERPGIDRPRGKGNRAPVEAVGGFIGKLRGYVYALDEIDHPGAVRAADAPLAEWNKLLTEIIVPLNRLRGEIRKVLDND